MIGKRLRSLSIQATVIVFLPLLTAGCFFNLSEKKDFQSWYYGDPGLAGALGEEKCDRYADHIQGARHPYYLHFRTPEILLQPQGGAQYPARQTAESRVGGPDADAVSCEKVDRGWETFRFDAVDAGFVDTVIPYRKASSVNDHERGFGQQSLAYAEGLAYNTGLTVVMKAPVYIVHDILKTLYIPVAGTYYLIQTDTAPEPDGEIIQVQDTPPSEESIQTPAAEAPSITVTEEKPQPPGGPAVDRTEKALARGAAGTASAGDDSGAPTSLDDAVARTPAEPGMDTAQSLPAAGLDATAKPAPAQPDPDRSAPPPPAAESPTEAEAETTVSEAPPVAEADDEAAPAAPVGEIAGESPAAIAAAPGAIADEDPQEEAPVSVETGEPEMADAAETAPRGAETETESSAETASARAARDTDRPEEGSVGAAVTTLTAIAKGRREAGAEVPAPSEDRTESIEEEDLLTDDPSKNEGAAPEDQAVSRFPVRPGDAATPEPETAPVPLARVAPAQEGVASEAPAAPEALDQLRVSKRALRKKVAFIGFSSRSANVDQSTKAYLQDQVWPEFEDECRSNLILVRQGDADYPAALDALIRDQFGRLNSFELTTVARFSGLNAIIAGTIIDIRVAREVSGILWYKSPEGQLRLTILVEVFDAETGTKLFDHTYIREEEVEELEPGTDEKLRKEDRPVLEATLNSVAADVGEEVCEALEDQPWRAFVSGIDGERITLSAGQSAGLKPGHVLGVYNSQIIDGLNNQQFFLTGEKVGRIQIVNVSDHRSEAILIEGRGLRDYSVAIPE